jgi:hypothetical protein
VDAAALARKAIAGQALPVSVWSARGRTALQRLGQDWRAAHGPSKGLVEVAAYGEVVWSWHPLLMSSWRRRSRPNRARHAAHPFSDGDKKEFVAGESTKETVKTIAQEAPGVSGVPVVTTVCIFCAHGLRVPWAPGVSCAL